MAVIAQSKACLSAMTFKKMWFIYLYPIPFCTSISSLSLLLPLLRLSKPFIWSCYWLSSFPCQCHCITLHSTWNTISQFSTSSLSHPSSCSCSSSSSFFSSLPSDLSLSIYIVSSHLILLPLPFPQKVLSWSHL
jgi:hypothetical protein